MHLCTITETIHRARSIRWPLRAVLVCVMPVLLINCRKDGHSCSGDQCQNGGICSNGTCECPVTYTGDHCETLATTHISYVNNTYTPITIVVNGDSSSIPEGQRKTFSGQYTTYISVTASTCGAAGNGRQLGELMTWSYNTPFPESDTTIVNMDVAADYFFLKIKDNDPAYSTNTVEVYYYGYDRYDTVAIPNNGAEHSVGYYRYLSAPYVNTLVEVTSLPSKKYWDFTVSLQPSVNQSCTVVVP